MATGLKDKVRDRAAQADGGGGQPGAEVARRDPPSLRKQIEEMLPQFAMAMPKGFEAQQLMRDAFTLMRQTPRLAECVPESVLGGLMTFAQLGLRPGVLGQGWLIPFKKRAQVDGRWVDIQVAQIVIGYQGFVELIHRTGLIRKIVGRAVHANDFYECEYGFNERLIHRPPTSGPRGEVVRYYAIIFPAQGDPLFWDMTVEEAKEWRAHFAMSTKKDFKGNIIWGEDGSTTGSGPWYDEEGPVGGTGFDQMAIKTCFLRARRFAPKSTDRMLSAAAEVDGAVRMSFQPQAADDYDEMLTAEHPEHADLGAGDVVDAEVVDPAPAKATAAPRASRKAAAPTVVDAPDDEQPGQASQAQHKRIMALLGRRVKTDAHRHALFNALLDRDQPITSQAQVTAEEADQVYEILKGWGQAGQLDAEVAALDPANAEAPAADATTVEAGGVSVDDLPSPGSQEWHDQGHPRLSDGQLTTVPGLFNGDCGFCDGPQ